MAVSRTKREALAHPGTVAQLRPAGPGREVSEPGEAALQPPNPGDALMAEAGEAGAVGGAVGGAAVPEEDSSPAPGGPAAGKAPRGPPKCGLCKEVGHNTRSCPHNPKSTTAGPSGLAEGDLRRRRSQPGRKAMPEDTTRTYAAVCLPEWSRGRALGATLLHARMPPCAHLRLPRS